jgi:CheY-like chemotaxis protein
MLAPAVSATILVVDDLDMIRRMVTRMLTLAGYTVVEAADGHEALTVLRSHGQPVDLVLTVS